MAMAMAGLLLRTISGNSHVRDVHADDRKVAVSGDAEERVASAADGDPCKGKADAPTCSSCCCSQRHAELVQAAAIISSGSGSSSRPQGAVAIIATRGVVVVVPPDSGGSRI